MLFAADGRTGLVLAGGADAALQTLHRPVGQGDLAVAFFGFGRRQDHPALFQRIVHLMIHLQIAGVQMDILNRQPRAFAGSQPRFQQQHKQVVIPPAAGIGGQKGQQRLLLLIIQRLPALFGGLLQKAQPERKRVPPGRAVLHRVFEHRG